MRYSVRTSLDGELQEHEVEAASAKEAGRKVAADHPDERVLSTKRTARDAPVTERRAEVGTPMKGRSRKRG